MKFLDYRFLEDVARTADHISRDAFLKKPISNKHVSILIFFQLQFHLIIWFIFLFNKYIHSVAAIIKSNCCTIGCHMAFLGPQNILKGSEVKNACIGDYRIDLGSVCRMRGHRTEIRLEWIYCSVDTTIAKIVYQ